MISKFLFLAVLVAVFAIFDIYLYKRLLRFFALSVKTKKRFLAFICVWQAGFAVLFISGSFWEIRPYFSAVLGFMLFCAVFGVALELLRPFRLEGRFRPAFTAIFVSLFAYSFYAGAAKPKIKQIKIQTDAPALRGLKFAVVTDAHIDPSKKEFAKSLASIVNSIRPDAVLIVGDLCDGRIGELKEPLASLSSISSKYGTFFAPGNHEYYYADFDEKMEFLRGLGFKTLVNSNQNIAGFTLVGLSDPAAKKTGYEEPNPSLAFKGASAPAILLSHQPLTAKEALPYKPSVVFCGHTHNGQIWPFSYLVALVQPYVYGEYEDSGSKIVVTSGAGVWGPPMRLFSESEVLEVLFF